MLPSSTLALLEKNPDPIEKRKFFDHLAEMFSLQNNFEQLVELTFMRLTFFVSQ